MFIGIIQNNKIVDVLVVETLELAEEAINTVYPNSEKIDLTENPENIGKDWVRINNEWLPPEEIN